VVAYQSALGGGHSGYSSELVGLAVGTLALSGQPHVDALFVEGVSAQG
jgi:hypothetical protein